jgi:hypothetical protein
MIDAPVRSEVTGRAVGGSKLEKLVAQVRTGAAAVGLEEAEVPHVGLTRKVFLGQLVLNR